MKTTTNSGIEAAELIFFRKISLIGAVLLFAISAIMYFDDSVIDRPLIRIILASLLIVGGVGSYFMNTIKQHSLQFLYTITSVYVIYAIYITYLNNFQVYDTSTTMVVSFALGALFKNKKFLLGYLLAVYVSFLFFMNIAVSPECTVSYVYSTITLMMILAYFVYSGKISAMEALTESKIKLEASEQRFRDIFQHSPLGIILLDASGRLFKSNKVVQNLLEYEEEELNNLYVGDYVQDAEAFDIKLVLENLKLSPTKSLMTEQRMKTKYGKTIWGRTTMATIDQNINEESFIICMIEDISFEKEANVKLTEYADKLKTHNKALEEFSYVISHDLQEPLRMIKSYSELIKRRYISQIKDENAALDMSYVIDGAERMSRLIKDMLAYSRWSAKPFDSEEVNTQDVLVEVLKNLAMSLRDNDAVIYSNHLPQLKTNKLLLGQVFQNLIGNGIKYSFKGRKPVIEIIGEQRDFDILFQIKDNGQGFKEKDKERIFGIFQRLHGRESEYTGTGIGLAICKRVIEKQGGKIWAEAVDGEGATFYFTLPLNQEN